MPYRLFANSSIGASIHLTASKSESNRALIIAALQDTKITLENIAKAKDTQTLQELLLKVAQSDREQCVTLDVGPAGTTMRFLTAYLAIQKGDFILTGSERMCQRPIGILVEALRQMGASIHYLEKEGFPPLKITGKSLGGGIVQLDPSVSSQFVSALMLIAPQLKTGLEIHFDQEPVSKSYIEMTAAIMEDFGVEVGFDGYSVKIKSQTYQATNYCVESDWSAASYWYALVALSNIAEVKLLGLKPNSYQGDSVLPKLFKTLGVVSSWDNSTLLLQKNTPSLQKKFNYNFENCPDIAQTVAVVCCGLGVPFHFTGLKTLKIKETDRITALINELAKFGYSLSSTNDDELRYDGISASIDGIKSVETYDDHRMAMAFAPLVQVQGEMIINNPEVVVKSYPDFWSDFQSAGILIDEI